MTTEEAPKMTNPEILKVKAILALIEAGDADDEDDAKAMVKMIRALVGGEKSAEAK
jgi:hypothetical protein